MRTCMHFVNDKSKSEQYMMVLHSRKLRQSSNGVHWLDAFPISPPKPKEKSGR